MTSMLQRHTATIWLGVIILTLGGLFAASSRPVSLFPKIDYPRVVVSIDAGDRDPDQMAAEITRPIEVALREIPGVIQVRSRTSRGVADVSLNFAWGQDMVLATQAVQGAVAALLPKLPAGTNFEVRRSDPTTMFPTIGFALTSDRRDATSLRRFAELQLRPMLLGVPGVAKVDVLGGSPREFAIDLNPAQLTALGLSSGDVTAAVAKANVIRGVGRIEDRHRLYLVLARHRTASIADLERIPVKAGDAGGAGLVLLGQIAKIEPTPAPKYTAVTSNGRPAVLLNVHQALSADTVAIASSVSSRLKNAVVPADISIEPYYDQSELVRGAAYAVGEAIVLGALLAGVVLFLFLRSARLMVITGLMLPAVLAAACLGLMALGLSFNMMTLGGMAAAVGLVVDDAVVMLEHIMRRMQEGEANETRGRLVAAAEMGKPLVGSTLATIIVFAPLAFISGVTGGFFKALAITMVAALGVSLLYARFVIPLVAAYWLREKDAEAAERVGGFLSHLVRIYERAADRAFAHRLLFVPILAIGLAVLGWVAWSNVPSGFMPEMDEGGFVLDYKAQSGASLTDTDRLLRQVEQIITATPEVASYSRRTGLQFGGGLTEPDSGDIFIRLKGGNRRPIEEVISEIRSKVERKVPGLQIETVQLMEDVIGDLTAVPQPIEVKLFSGDPATLQKAALGVAGTIRKIQGVVEVVDGLRVAGDALSVDIDPAAAAQHGLDPNAIATQLEALIAGVTPTQVRVGEQLLDVRVRGPASLRDRAQQIENLPLTAPDGHNLRVRQIAKVLVLAGQKQITREDLAPFVAVTARLDGRDLGSAMREVRAAVINLKLPKSVRVEYGGLYAEQQKSFADLAMVFGAALLLTTLLLSFLFERVAWTVSAVVTVLLSAVAVLLGLWITQIELNISALMGLTMVVGMVTELVIFYLAELDTDLHADISSLRVAGAKRLRPIVMSALIAILTLSPLALGFSRGAGLQKPLATAIIFGLTAAVPLVLIFLPAMIAVVQRRRAGV
ncbi:MAG: efflux RND transporter permease subunit [Hyphomicrobiales bacterium]|nr:efflux RND transporter permease subunit [Hyphomicrobiales bacterium]